MNKLLQIFILLTLGLSVYGSLHKLVNNSNQKINYNEKTVIKPDDTAKSRHKRFLVFNNGGLIKLVCGWMDVLSFMPTRPTGNIVNLYNFQAQFLFPPNVTTPFDKFKNRRLGERLKRNLEKNGDSSRENIYAMVENMLNRQNKNGKECILKSICETASTSLSHNGLIGDLVETFLKPGINENLHSDYKDAMLAGRDGIDCSQLFYKCPFGHGLLDNISSFEQSPRY